MKRPTIVLIILLCWSRFAAAQIQQASIEGTVVDSSGLAVPGAIIELLDPATSQTRSLATDSAGTFRFTNIPPGTYVLRAELSGFATYEQRDLALTVAQLARLSIVLTPASVAETVTVTAQVPLLDPSRTAGMSTVVDTERIEELPVRSRNYLEFTLLAPGVAPSQPGGRAPSTTSMADSGFSFAGLRPRSNLLTIDGLDNNDEVSGASRTELSLEIVREFQVVSNGWSAENGGASGGAINVVTKSGANTLHGDAFLFGQSGRLNALPKLEDLFGARPSLTRYRGGLAIGGPIARDRTFYYAAAEQEYTRGEAAADTGLGTPSTINAFLASGHLSRLATRELTLGLAPTALDETELSAKLTHQINSRHSVVARIAGTNTDERGDAFNSGGLSDASARGSSRTHDVALTGDWTGTLTSRITNDVRGQYATRRVARNTGDSAGPGMVVPGVAEFGRPYAGNDQNDQTYAEISDTLAVASRHHFVKAGATVTHVGVTVNGVDGLGGLYVFPTLNALLAGQPDSYRQTFAPPSATLATLRTGVFVQDHWTPRSALSFDLGVRFDASALPSALDITNRQVSPRIGVAWTPELARLRIGSSWPPW